MQRIIDDLIDPADHLALDEALLLEADAGSSSEALRLWEFSRHVVVAGRSTRVDEEIDRSFCQTRAIPVLRRCSGGAAVIGGPGCLMYSMVLSLQGRAALHRIDVAHQYVMQLVHSAVGKQLPEATLQGTCDLTWKNRKCSGNSLRIARRHLLYHGTLLYDFEIPLIGKSLKDAPRQPEYRSGRDHESFVTNVPIDPVLFAADLCESLEVTEEVDARPWRDRIRQLRSQRYDLSSWHLRH
jgi:lipoate-protein ligase A